MFFARMLRLPLRARILSMVALVELGFLVACSLILFVNAQRAIRNEVRSSEQLAREFAHTAVSLLLRENDPAARLHLLPAQLQQPRHARLTVVDADGQLLTPPYLTESDHSAPEWFVRLLQGVERRSVIPITIRNHTYGAIIVTTDRRDEIAEIWEDTASLFVAGLITCAFLLFAIDRVITHGLRPLGSIQKALNEMERQDYSIRVPETTIPDLQPITHGCNKLAAALEHALADMEQLNQALVHLQDHERKTIAMELHDEFGPCLFGIRMSANAVLQQAKQITGPLGERFTEWSHSILEITDTMQATNRQLLERLRPMAIGHVPLPQLLLQFIESMATHSPEVEWHVDVDPAIANTSETIQLTLYRVTQEAVSNALRHADPSHLTVEVGPSPPILGRGGATRRWYRVHVEDDGRGMSQVWREGGGLHGMSNRVKSLGGRLTIRSGEHGGTAVIGQVPDLEGGHDR